MVILGFIHKSHTQSSTVEKIITFINGKICRKRMAKIVHHTSLLLSPFAALLPEDRTREEFESVNNRSSDQIFAFGHRIEVITDTFVEKKYI